MHLIPLVLGGVLLGQLPGPAQTPAADGLRPPVSPRSPAPQEVLGQPDLPPSGATPGVSQQPSPVVIQPPAKMDLQPPGTSAAGPGSPTGKSAAAAPSGAAGPGAAGPGAAQPEAPPRGAAGSATAPGAPAPGSVPEDRPSAPEILAEALKAPANSKLTGQALTLSSAISSTTDRRQLLGVTFAYWRLVEAVAGYDFALSHQGLLLSLPEQAGEAALLRSARAGGAAAVDEAELAAVAAQHELAALLSPSSEVPLPLPADLPHVGVYRTHFKEMFQARTAPVRARLLDRTLPIRRQAIEARAAAVRASGDALDASIQAHQRGQADLSAVLAAARQRLQHRQAFMATVFRYNCDIADYVLAVTPSGTRGSALLPMLITSPPSTGRPLTATLDGSVQPAIHNEPLDSPGRPLDGEPSRFGQEGQTGDGASPGQWTPANTATDGDPIRRLPPVDAPTGTAVPPSSSSASPTLPPYAPLANLDPALRAKRLSEALCGQQASSPEAGKPLSLAECLGAAPAAERWRVIQAYWDASHRAATHRVLDQQAGFLKGLSAFAPGDAAHPSTLRLHAAQWTTEAAILEAQADLIEAQLELASRLGRGADPVWPIPSTVPHAASYRLKLDQQPSQLVSSWPMRRLSATIPGLAGSIQQFATAVVEADLARADAMAGCQAATKSIDQAMPCIGWETDQSLAFLETLADYNQAIAQYALTVLPPTIPGEQLVAALVVQRSEPRP